MSAALTAAELEQARAHLAHAGPEQVLAWVEERFGDKAALASSFSVEDMVLIHLASLHAPRLRIFTLDTGRLPPETYEVLEVVRSRYRVEVETFFPEAGEVEALTRAKGHFSFRRGLEERHECCAIRKLKPLERALAGRAAWVTGLRREQSPTRTGVEVVEVDSQHGGLAKVSPLASWSEQQVWAYVAEHGLPYNALHDRGYRSIGCAPCTRALKPYEDVRAGRWWWEQPENKECGLHARR